jgi:hypothetical protein
MRKVRVKYRKGVFEPVEPVDLPEEKEAEVIVPTDEPVGAGPAGVPAEDIWAGYDPERVRAALRERTGVLTERDAEDLIAKIYRWREEGTRPADRS